MPLPSMFTPTSIPICAWAENAEGEELESSQWVAFWSLVFEGCWGASVPGEVDGPVEAPKA